MISVLAVLPQMDPTLQIGAAIIALAVAVIFHEVAHGVVALRLGDPTAFYAGRLTLNPLKHVDIVGTIVIPIILALSNTGIMFGWAKPVPVNYYNLKGGKYGPVMVALAGPATNFLLLILFAVMARISPAGTAMPYLFLTIALTNGFLMLFNLIPIPPLDGSKVLYLFLERRPDVIALLERYSMFVLVGILLLGGQILTGLVVGPAFRLTSFFAGLSVYELVRLLG